jgi:4-diphosphocytidyl-2-C-methyl-D-erythritol kinase
LNLFLNVIGRRSDGFHELESLMVPVRIFDSLALRPVSRVGEFPGSLTLRVRQRSTQELSKFDDLSERDDNLVLKALTALRRASGCMLGAHVELLKRIPIGAGLGGGSSDAAAALILANRAWGLGWSPSRLAQVASEIGSDVPFFLADGPAICRGRGEQIEHLALSPLHFVVVCPPHSLSTAMVYQSLAADLPIPPRATTLSALVELLRGGAIGSIGQLLWNGLAQTAARLLPAVSDVQRAFGRLDFVGHQLTGSGSAYFGVCRSAHQAAQLAALLRARLRIWSCATCSGR